jgi:hypothetical protein
MKTKQKIACITFAMAVLLCNPNLNAQVNIGSLELPTPGAILDLSRVSTKDMGLLLPQVSLANLSTWQPLSGTAINGMLVYNTNASTGIGVYLWKNDKWVALDSSTNVINTSADVPLTFAVNNNRAGSTGSGAEYGKNNVSFGWKTLYPSVGYGNIAMGVQALEWNSGSGNTGIGLFALNANSGDSNVAIGNNTLAVSTTGHENVAIGFLTLSHSTTSSYNTAVGTESMLGATTASGNTSLGFKTLRENITGAQNVAIGTSALEKNLAYNNTAVGFQALSANTTGDLNTAIGAYSMHLNTTGKYNLAVGSESLRKNISGVENIACGPGALYSNTTGSYNTTVGNAPLWFNETGSQNVAVGDEALSGNVSGSWNTAVGTRALWSVKNVGENATLLGAGKSNNNTALGYEAMRDLVDGYDNTAVGLHALMNNSTGSGNTSVGTYSLNQNTTGTNNTAIGFSANVGSGNLTNATAIGSGAMVNESNQVVIGNNNVTSIGGKVMWSTLSDRRIKKNIQQNVPGISFINKLRPITYNLDLDAIDRIQHNGTIPDLSQEELEDRSLIQQIIYTGFIAQEVEEVAKSLGYDFSGVQSYKTGNGLYQLRYSEFVVPLVKAVQELVVQNEANEATIISLQIQINELRDLMNQLIDK